MGFLMDGLDPEEYDRAYTDRQLVARIVRYFRPQARKMAIVAGATVLASLVDTAVPILIARSLDRLQANPVLSSLAGLAALISLLSATSWVFNATRRWLSTEAVADVVLHMREDAFDAVTARDLSFYDQFPSGKIVSRVNSDTQAFSQVITLSMDLLGQILLIILLISYLSFVSLRLTLILLGLAPLIVVAALAFRAMARRTITASRRVNATVSSHIQETISGIGVAKTFRRERAIYEEFLPVNEQSFQVTRRTRFVFSSIFPVLNMLAGIATALLVYFGGLTVQAGALTAGGWFLFIQGLQMFWFPLTSIASFWSQFQIGLAAGERVFALIDAEARVVQTGAEVIEQPRGDILFEDVGFTYKQPAGDELTGADRELPTANWVLRAFNLHISPGETLALVGHTGSGKSSIGKLIARFYEFQEGRILIDGHDIRALDLGAYRARLGIVTQTPFLFDGTVMENIRYGRPDASDAEVEQVARHVGGGDWIMSLPRGLATEAGERGANLSMGQRQIVALARVLLQDPAIVILDEATASIDPLTETLIQEGLDEVLAGRTAIVIAHRLSTVRTADRIVVLRQGEIIEQGDHEMLLARGGHYAELYNTYFRHQSLEYIEGVAAL
ncbi:ABC transporter [Kouleothrix aurantiaca]|jgi:ABC-type multidrug transport system fused ATPase/permease subunit|uniref:ABC transporter n=1 Tax=Kouleothrix aurantiaca TaxID=186479 RepID=A0A0P9D6A5_9CHLR|nr:ABC transporter [Kouleothrix aurantiaca]